MVQTDWQDADLLFLYRLTRRRCRLALRGGRAGAAYGEEAAQPETRIDSVPCLCQYPAFPTGCVTYYEKEKTEKAYTALGCQAVVVTAA